METMTDTQKLSRFCECGAPWVESYCEPREVKPDWFNPASVEVARREGWEPMGGRVLKPGYTVDYKCDRGHWITVPNDPVEWVEPALTKEEWEAAAWREPNEVAGGEFRYGIGAP
jgi:hypothetical protein